MFVNKLFHNIKQHNFSGVFIVYGRDLSSQFGVDISRTVFLECSYLLGTKSAITKNVIALLWSFFPIASSCLNIETIITVFLEHSVSYFPFVCCREVFTRETPAF